MFLRPGGVVIGMDIVAEPVARSVWKLSCRNGIIEPEIALCGAPPVDAGVIVAVDCWVSEAVSELSWGVAWSVLG